MTEHPIHQGNKRRTLMLLYISSTSILYLRGLVWIFSNAAPPSMGMASRTVLEQALTLTWMQDLRCDIVQRYSSSVGPEVDVVGSLFWTACCLWLLMGVADRESGSLLVVEWMPNGRRKPVGKRSSMMRIELEKGCELR